MEEYLKERVLSLEESKALSERRPKEGGSFGNWLKKMKEERLWKANEEEEDKDISTLDVMQSMRDQFTDMYWSKDKVWSKKRLMN